MRLRTVPSIASGQAEATSAPLGDAAFAQVMAALGPFEPGPALAVAVSGGADSLALTLLAASWIRSHGGSLLALTVDHRLRHGSTAEALQVGAWLAARGIDHRILTRTGTKPTTGLQAAARRARYRLIEGYCRESGILHVLLGHHRRDQAETVVLRASAGSGPAGLAGMAPVVEAPSCRFIRPLLEIDPAPLRAYLRARGQPWIEDPGNRDPRFARTTLRRPTAAGRQSTEPALTRFAARQRCARIILEEAVSRLVAEAVTVHPAGLAWLDWPALVAAAPPVAASALGSVIACIGGRAHPPAAAKLARLVEGLSATSNGRSMTLGGCRLRPAREHLLIHRESRNLPPAMAVPPGDTLLWDNRFLISFATTAPHQTAGTAWLAPLGRETAQTIAAAADPRINPAIPRAAWEALPALSDGQGLIHAPHLGYRRPGAAVRIARISFHPATPAGGAGCFLAYELSPIM
ncbi:MAG: tRNA lysidine(34) synthetase TilS [Rhodospirillales bacterium]|nr:MAG: tRNA lysidine(34) synthetase TilS [Rhodospirillales bacterium]